MLAYYFGSAPKYRDTQSRDSWLYWLTIKRLASLWLCVLWSVKRQNTHRGVDGESSFRPAFRSDTWPFYWIWFNSPWPEGALQERLPFPQVKSLQYLHLLFSSAHKCLKSVWWYSNNQTINIILTPSIYQQSHLRALYKGLLQFKCRWIQV